MKPPPTCNCGNRSWLKPESHRHDCPFYQDFELMTIGESEGPFPTTDDEIDACIEEDELHGEDETNA